MAWLRLIPDCRVILVIADTGDRNGRRNRLHARFAAVRHEGTVRVTLSAFAPGTYAVSASVGGSEDDVNTSNNAATATVEIIGVGDAIFSSGFD